MSALISIKQELKGVAGAAGAAGAATSTCWQLIVSVCKLTNLLVLLNDIICEFI